MSEVTESIYKRENSEHTSNKVQNTIRNADLNDLIRMALKKNEHQVSSNLERYIYDALIKQIENDFKEGKCLFDDAESLTSTETNKPI